jgi:transaldolase
MSKTSDLTHLGQSLWYDNIQRRLLENGEMAGMIARGEIRGVTSNPTIFNNAIAKSNDYDAALVPMAQAGLSAAEMFDRLAVDDIRHATDLFSPVFRESKGGDGFVSIEVSPNLAHDTAGTLAEARRLWALVDRPNLMVKIPATLEGIPAVRQAIAVGINVNITLIFSLARYAQVMEAYLCGLEDRLAAGLPVDALSSVASFFVSRVDTKIDPQLGAIVQQGGPESALAKSLPGKAAIANTQMAYALFKQTFNTPRFKQLAAKGARLQRPLWASTSTKNPAFPDLLYVDNLIAPHTVNTVPPATLTAFIDHGKVALTLEGHEDAARQVVRELESLGISMDKVTQELEDEGVKSFSDAFASLLKTIDERRLAALAGAGKTAPEKAG